MLQNETKICFSFQSLLLHFGTIFFSLCSKRTAVRALSTGEISTALRPFYFTVHPDLFGQYPTQRVRKQIFDIFLTDKVGVKIRKSYNDKVVDNMLYFVSKIQTLVLRHFSDVINFEIPLSDTNTIHV